MPATTIGASHWATRWTITVLNETVSSEAGVPRVSRGTYLITGYGYEGGVRFKQTVDIEWQPEAMSYVITGIRGWLPAVGPEYEGP